MRMKSAEGSFSSRHLDRNPGLTVFPIGLVQLENLASLRLAGTGLTLLPKNLTLLQQLNTLDASYCQLHTVPSLDTMPHLNTLKLAHNKLTVPPKLWHPERFRTIEWSGNPFCELEEHRNTRPCIPDNA